MLLSFIIPCYGSEETISFVIDELKNVVAERSNFDYEVIAVNDFSFDNVIEKLKKIAADNKKVKVLDLAKNVGKQAAQMAAYSVVNGDIIINMDDDGQCPMDRLWDLIDPLFNGYDVSIARYPKKKQSKFKNFGSRLNSIMAEQLIDKPKTLQLSNFSAVKRFVIDEAVKYTNPYPYTAGLFLRTTARVINVEMEERNRFSGVGNFTFKKSFSLWMNGFTAFSVKPLRIATFLGFICAVIGFIFGVYTVINKFINPDILMGYSSLMAVQLFIGGMIMLMLGLIGEYVGRMYISMNNAPQYVVREAFNLNKKNEDDYE